jgi:hypothetical protein
MSACWCASIAQGATILTQTYSGPLSATITGTLPNEGTVLLENFTLPMPSDLGIYSTSYATGGFSPDLMLFDTDGTFVADSNLAGFPDPNTGLTGDASLNVDDMTAGLYTLAVIDSELHQAIAGANLSGGFTVDDGDGTTFLDGGGNVRTGNFAVTLNMTAVPEPASIFLALMVFGVLMVLDTLNTRGGEATVNINCRAGNETAGAR